MTGYFHLSRLDVQVGQDVTQGQQLGLVGSTGYVTGPHLHFEVRIHNVNVEPLEWLGEGDFQRPDLALGE
jgi:murein DD-endopeptidase MepM/ murein hydrolase activator NlpD